METACSWELTGNMGWERVNDITLSLPAIIDNTAISGECLKPQDPPVRLIYKEIITFYKVSTRYRELEPSLTILVIL